MTEETEKPDQSQGAEQDAGEISLENIDEILQEEDPDFVNSLGEIKEAGADVEDVELESLNVDVEGNITKDDEEKVGRLTILLAKILKKYPKLKVLSSLSEKAKKFVSQRLLIWRGRIKLWFFNSIEQIKTWPDRFRKFSSDAKIVLGKFNAKMREGFSSRSKLEKSLIMVLIFGSGIVAGLTLLNLKKSRWIPFVKQPMLMSMADVAEQAWSYDASTGTLAFLSAFPQTKHNYLFPKVVVNLKTRPGGNEFQMGAFEFYVEVDSKDTAIEVKSREVELHDLIQRVVEGFSYDSLQSERGKERLKEEIKKALNQKIVQGWVKGVYIKFMITKP